METQGRTLAKRLNVRLRVKLRETWPFPTRVIGDQFKNNKSVGKTDLGSPKDLEGK